MEDFDLEDEQEETPVKAYWRCEECGHRDTRRAMPRDRAMFYAKVARDGSPVCPKCRSVGFMPVGF